MKACINCCVTLADSNWDSRQKKNYINKCSDCLRDEKRAYAANWRAKNPGKASEKSKRHKEKTRKENPAKSRALSAYSDCRKRSLKNGMEFDLTTDFIYGMLLATKVCPYFGWEITFDIGKGKTLASIDRIDSSKGYTKDNVQVVSYLANLMKSSANDNELLMFARGVLKQNAFHSL